MGVKGINKLKISLTIALTLVVILAVFNIWLFMKVDALQKQGGTLIASFGTLEEEKTSLENQ